MCGKSRKKNPLVQFKEEIGEIKNNFKNSFEEFQKKIELNNNPQEFDENCLKKCIELKDKCSTTLHYLKILIVKLESKCSRKCGIEHLVTCIEYNGIFNQWIRELNESQVKIAVMITAKKGLLEKQQISFDLQESRKYNLNLKEKNNYLLGENKLLRDYNVELEKKLSGKIEDGQHLEIISHYEQSIESNQQYLTEPREQTNESEQSLKIKNDKLELELSEKFIVDIDESKKTIDFLERKCSKIEKTNSKLLNIITLYGALLETSGKLRNIPPNVDYAWIEEEIQQSIFRFDEIEPEDDKDVKTCRKAGIIHAKKMSKYIEEITSQQPKTTKVSTELDDEDHQYKTLDDEMDPNQGLCPEVLQIDYKLNELRLQIDNFTGKSKDEKEYRMIDSDLVDCILELDRIKTGDPIVKDQKRATIKKAKLYMSELDKRVDA